MNDPAILDESKRAMLREHLLGRGIKDTRVLEAMSRVPRERFVTAEHGSEAYADRALAIDCDQTISQPYIVGLMTQALELTGAETVLEIGTGSGYQTAILAELAQSVVTVERHSDLSFQAGVTLADLGYRNITRITADGAEGWPPLAPYDRIIVTAAAIECPPALLKQLRDGGILVIPVGDKDAQMLRALRRTGDTTTSTDLTACRFVPLVHSLAPPPT